MYCTLSVVFIYLWLTCSLFSKINIKDMKGILQIHYEHLWEISAYIFNESNIYIQNITSNLGVPYYYICSPKIHSILKPIVGN